MARTRWISALMAGFLAMCMLLASCAQPAGGGTGGGGGSGYTPPTPATPTPATPESKVVGTYIGGSLLHIFKSGGTGSVSSSSLSIRALADGETFTWAVTGTSGDTISVAITNNSGETFDAEFNTASGKATIDGVECTKQGSGGGSSSPSTPEHVHNYVFVDFTWNGFNAVANYRCSGDASHTKTENADITSVVTKTPTESEEGIRTYTATYDGHTDTKTQTIPVLGSETFINFTWTDDFTAVANYNTGSEPATVTSRQTKAATCTGAGIRKYTATSGVNYEEKEEILPPLGHDYVFRQFTWRIDLFDDASYEDVSVLYTCSRVTSHRLTPGPKATVTSKITKEPTITETGIRRYTATYDGHTDTKTEVLPKVQLPPSEGLVYTLSADQSYYILSNGKNCTDAAISIPATYNGKPVNEIGENAFSYCQTLTTIIIPDSVTSIGKWAFYDCRNLASIVIGSTESGLTSIVIDSFTNCNKLAKIYFNGDINKWVEIENLVYLYASKTYSSSTTLYINGQAPTSIEITTASKINDYAFAGCKQLQSVTIGNSVTRIGSSAFQACSALTSVTIGNKVEEIAFTAFKDCKITSITIPDSVKLVRDDAFENCPIETATVPTSAIAAIKNAKLKTVKITSGESIEEFAFSNCTALTSVTIPTSVKSIEVQAFQNCTALTSVTIPTSVTSIGVGAFRECTALTSIVISDSVTSIERHAFYGCSRLTSVTIGTGVTSIKEYTFSGCSALRSVTLGNKVEEIGFYAFNSCSSLTSIQIPDSVTSIGDLAFAYCSKLTRVTMGDGVTYISSVAFADSPIENLTLPASAIDYNIKKIDTLKTVKIIGTGIIPNQAFQNCSTLTSVTIGAGVTSIANSAFSGCTALKSIIIPNSVRLIGHYAFENCSSATSVTMGTGVTGIGNSAFSGCSKLATITFAGTSTQWESISKGTNWYKGTLIDRITVSGGYQIPPE